MKTAYIRKTIYLIFLLAVLFSAGCVSNDQNEPDPIGIKIRSPKFDEISTIYSDVEVSLKFISNNGGVTECNVFIGTDTKVKGTCGDMPFGTYAYNLEYTYQGLTIAKSIGSITIDENNTETPITLLDKSVDEDNDGCSNLQEVIVGSNPLVQDTCIPPPTDLTATAKSTVQIDLTWTASTGATGYNIFRREGADGADTEIGTSTQTSYSDTSLKADTTYCYKVSANGNGTESIPTDMVCGKTENGLVAFYPFNGNANDESGNGNNGTVSGATLVADRKGNANSAYSFDGNDYINLGNRDSLTLGAAGSSYAIGLWFKTTGNVGPWADVLIASGYSRTNALDPFDMLLAGDGRICWMINNSNTGVYQICSTSTYNNNQWHHAVGLRNDEIMSLYIDGQLVAGPETFPLGNATSNVNVYIGIYTLNNPDAGEYFHGSIDDVRIYNRALTDAEVLALYNEGE